jgi:hypothetical protein
MRYLRSFSLSRWDHVVGDDRRTASGLAVGLALTWWVRRSWLLSLAVALVLVVSVLREAARRPCA